MDDLRLVYVTCPDAADARRIGMAVVEERLAACVNILPAMESIYRWQGAIESAQEAVLIVKTIAARIDDLIARVRALHAYSVPCILVLPLIGGNPAYGEWLRRESQLERPIQE